MSDNAAIALFFSILVGGGFITAIVAIILEYKKDRKAMELGYQQERIPSSYGIAWVKKK